MESEFFLIRIFFSLMYIHPSEVISMQNHQHWWRQTKEQKLAWEATIWLKLSSRRGKGDPVSPLAFYTTNLRQMCFCWKQVSWSSNNTVHGVGPQMEPEETQIEQQKEQNMRQLLGSQVPACKGNAFLWATHAPSRAESSCREPQPRKSVVLHTLTAGGRERWAGKSRS